MSGGARRVLPSAVLAAAVALAPALPIGAGAAAAGLGTTAVPAGVPAGTVTGVSVSWLEWVGRTPRARSATAPDAAAAAALVVRLRARPDVTAATVSSTYHRAGGVTAATTRRLDPLIRYQWGLPAVGATAAWRSSTGYRVLVAVIDDGVDARHPDLAGNVVTGWNVLKRSSRVDAGAHGTHVAGIIAARYGNGVGGSGLAPRALILPVDVFASSTTTDAIVASGIIYAANRGARVINMSLGGPDASPVLRQAVRYAQSRGAVLVAAAGNEGDVGNPVEYPAGFAGVVGVGAIDRSRDHPSWSNTGRHVDLVAPGVDITSLAPNRRYATASGTSMATPFVSAAAALVRAKYPRWTPGQVISRLQTSAVDLGAAGYDVSFGFGLVSPGTALGGAPSAPPSVVAAPDAAASSLAVSWKAPTFPGPTGIARYRVELSVDGGRSWTQGRDLPVTARTTVFGGIAAGSVAVARVGAVARVSGARSAWATTSPHYVGPDAAASQEFATPLATTAVDAITPAGDNDWFVIAPAGVARRVTLSGAATSYRLDLFLGPDLAGTAVAFPGADATLDVPAGGPWHVRVVAADLLSASPFPYRLTLS